MDTSRRTGLRFTLLNDWQRGFPLVDEPFAAIGARCGAEARQVLDGYRGLMRDAAMSRIGGVWNAGAGGAALLCALAVPEDRLDAVAQNVSAFPGVNHNYEREHHHNLWFVITGRDAGAVTRAVDEIEAATGCTALRLRMQRAYRIDLGFDLRGRLAPSMRSCLPVGPPVAATDAPLAALLEGGLPLVERPYDVWARALGRPAHHVMARLDCWLREGTLRRFGVIVRHHEAGFEHNAMTVFDVPDERVDACGAALAAEPGVTLAYRRERAPGWRYNLYCMVHGRDRAAVRGAIDAAIRACGLADNAHEVLFSRRRFKQGGASYFRAPAEGGALVPA
jgi:siroheme decarboxylase